MRKVNVHQYIDKAKLNKFHISIFIVILLCVIFDGYDQSVYGISLTTLMADTGIDAAVFGLIGTYTLLGMLAGSLFFGTLGDKIGRPKTLALGIILYSVGTGMFGFSNTVLEFTIYRVLTGVGLAGIIPVGIPVVSEFMPAKYRNTFVGFVTAGVPLGTILAPTLGLVFLADMGWRPLYWIGFIPIFMVIVIFLMVPESLERLIGQKKYEKIKQVMAKAAPDYTPEENDLYVTHTSGQQGEVKKAGFLDLFRNGMARNTILIWFAFIGIMFFSYGVQTWLPNILVQGGFPVENSMVFMLVYACGSIPGVILSGWAERRLGFKRAIAIFTGVCAATMLLVATGPSVALMFVLLFVCGSGMYGAFALVYAFAADNYPNAVRGTGVGFSSGAGRLGGSFAPMVGGFLAAAAAPMAVSLTVFAVAMAVACFCILLTKKRKEYEEETEAVLVGEKTADALES